jgi:tetratricopeptide (TPR) repeat protein
VSTEVARAWQFLQLGRAKEAAASATRHLAKEPDSLGGLLLLGVAQFDLGHRTEGLATVRRAIGKGPTSGAAHGVLGRLLMVAGNLTEAQSSLRRALQLDPEFADAHGALAECAELRGRWQTVLGHSARALRLQPDDPDLHHVRAHALWRLGRRGEATATITAGLRCDPEHLGLRRLRGLMLAEQGGSGEGLVVLEEALRADAGDWRSRACLAHALRLQFAPFRWLCELRQSKVLHGLLQATMTVWFVSAFLMERRWSNLQWWFAFPLGLFALLAFPLVTANLRLALHRRWRHLLSRRQLRFTITMSLCYVAAATVLVWRWS